MRDPGTLLAVVEVDDADPVLKLVQDAQDFARRDQPVHIINDVGAWRLRHQHFQSLARGRIDIDAQDAYPQLRAARTLNDRVLPACTHFDGSELFGE